MNKPPFRPLNLQDHEVIALQIVVEDYLKDRQSTLLSKVGDIHLQKILDKLNRLKGGKK